MTKHNGAALSAAIALALIGLTGPTSWAGAGPDKWKGDAKAPVSQRKLRKRDRAKDRGQPAAHGAEGHAAPEPCIGAKPEYLNSSVNTYIAETLKVTNPLSYSTTLKFACDQEAVMKAAGTPAPAAGDVAAFWELAQEYFLKNGFSKTSEPTLKGVIQGLSRPSSNNAALIGQSGVGKSFTVDQMIAIFSYGIIPDFMRDVLGDDNPGSAEVLDAFKKSFVGKTQFVTIKPALFSKDNTKPGEAWTDADTRKLAILQELFEAAQEDFKEDGIRTVFVLEEIGTFPLMLLQPLLDYLGDNGFIPSDEPHRQSKNLGYSVIPITTTGEWQQVLRKVPALRRRVKKVYIFEPKEEEALGILKKESRYWVESNKGKLEMGDDVLDYIIAMRRFFPEPSLAMPDSILKQANELFKWRLRRMGRVVVPEGQHEAVSIEDAWEFFVEQAHLPKDLWLPNDGEPLHDLAARVKKRVTGHEGAIDKIAAVMQAAALTGFREIPLIVLGGISGSGKDTIVRAFNIEMFGHDGEKLKFHLDDDSYESVMERTQDGELPELVSALEGDQRSGLIMLNDAKDLSGKKMRKLKSVTERGQIMPHGGDLEARRFGINAIVLAGEWGEELLVGKTDAEVAKIMAEMTDEQLYKIFQDGYDGKTGALSRSQLDRAVRSGALILLPPVKKSEYGKLVDPTLASVIADLKRYQGVSLAIEESLKDLIVRSSQQLNYGPRRLEAIAFDLTRGAILKAGEQGLRYRGSKLTLRAVPGKLEIEIVDSTPGRAPKSYIVTVEALLRSQNAGHCIEILKRAPAQP